MNLYAIEQTQLRLQYRVDGSLISTQVHPVDPRTGAQRIRGHEAGCGPRRAGGVPRTYRRRRRRGGLPYGEVRVELQPGGAEFASGIAIPAMGDKGDALVVALCCVTVGY